jgi:hypothetical protein
VCNGCSHGKVLPKCLICKKSRNDAIDSKKLIAGTISLTTSTLISSTDHGSGSGSGSGSADVTCPACTYINIGSSIECVICLFPFLLHA